MSEPLPVKEPSEEDKVKAQALSDLEDIRTLRKMPAFSRYLLRRLEEKKAPIVDSLLRSRLAPEDVRARQAQLAAYEEILKLLDDDAAGNVSIVRQG